MCVRRGVFRRECSESTRMVIGNSLSGFGSRKPRGAWLALAGEHPKVVQTIMRHSQITLTMDTYGHLFPGQAAEAVGRFGHMLRAE